ncbi:hypothetical protein SL1157_1676 [Ruegeria lacuscaerulensis ITI-1157]|nr:hypothetical protein SL1157_1676 [Ruegeria lacuscaerulensis ITI-1157]SHK06045.1 Chaperone of endosialidase [Ruegeria lacuscaerulensis ITI-1157]
MALPPQTIIQGNPPTASHQPNPTELVTWMDEIEATRAQLDTAGGLSLADGPFYKSEGADPSTGPKAARADRVFVGGSKDLAGSPRSTTTSGDNYLTGSWLQQGDEGDNLGTGPAGSRLQYIETHAALAASVGDAGSFGQIGVAGAAKATSGLMGLGTVGVARLDDPLSVNAWGGYFEAVRGNGTGGNAGCWGVEIGVMNFDNTSITPTNPMDPSFAGFTKGLMINSGGGNTNAFTADTAFQIRGEYDDGGTIKGARFNSGIVITDGALTANTVTNGIPNVKRAVWLPPDAGIIWANSTRTHNTEMMASEVGTIVLNRRGTTNPFFFDFRVDNTTVGAIRYDGTNTVFQTTSDRALKENIAPAGDAGAIIDALEVVQHDWIANGAHTSFGVIAQDVHEVFPDAVSPASEDTEFWMVDYSRFTPLLLQEVKALRRRVAALEAA